MHPGDVTEQIDGIRQQAVNILDELIAKAGEYELPDPPSALKRHRDKLRENSYKVLVVGEAKRGKSLFINALIGQHILPTDVDVATNQVFSIWPSRHEAYRLRFEDGSEREISSEDLPLYGSQAMADAGAVPAYDQTVRWIEIDVPVRFLPRNVTILDTPGLGALYAGHALITYRFVPEADAIIFVLESGQPVIDEDLKFIEEILAVTRNIFFVQTKIDLYFKEDWQDVLGRNQETLEKRFKGRLTDTRVWPVSSTRLLKAAFEDDESEKDRSLTKSGHKELTAALQAFLARVAGWGRVAEAAAAAAQYHTKGHETLAARLGALTAESGQKQEELRKAKVEGDRLFQEEWGLQGRKYKGLREDLQKTIAVKKQGFLSALQPGGDIELSQKAQIDAVKSLNDANRVREAMPEEVVTAALNTWEQVRKQVQDRCAQLLGPLAEVTEDADAPPDPELVGLAVPGSGLDEEFKRDYFVMVRATLGQGMLSAGLGSYMMSASATLLPLVAVPALLVLVGGTLYEQLKKELQTAKMQLKAQLSEVRQQVYRHFFDVDQASGRYSRFDEYFNALDRAVNEQLQEMVQKKSKESQAEIARLSEVMKLDDPERDARTKQTQEQLSKWNNIGKSTEVVMKRIRASERPRAPVVA